MRGGATTPSKRPGSARHAREPTRQRASIGRRAARHGTDPGESLEVTQGRLRAHGGTRWSSCAAQARTTPSSRAATTTTTSPSSSSSRTATRAASPGATAASCSTSAPCPSPRCRTSWRDARRPRSPRTSARPSTSSGRRAPGWARGEGPVRGGRRARRGARPGSRRARARGPQLLLRAVRFDAHDHLVVFRVVAGDEAGHTLAWRVLKSWPVEGGPR